MGLTISAVNLGYYASAHFCPRCAWLRLHVKTLPFQAFPGIFSSIDRYNKLVVRSYFDRESSPPLWLRKLGNVEAYVTPSHWSIFSVFVEEEGVTLRGEADGIFRMSDGSYTIVDYKTSRFTPAQRGLLREYEVQLNAYAYIGERLGLSPVRQLALIYMEPVTDEAAAAQPQVVDEQGFSMGFRATVVPVGVRPDELIPSLLGKARGINEMSRPPSGLTDCRDCAALDTLITELERSTQPRGGL